MLRKLKFGYHIKVVQSTLLWCRKDRHHRILFLRGLYCGHAAAQT